MGAPVNSGRTGLKKIFIIDDSQSTLVLLQKIIKSQGYEVEIFSDAGPAIERMKEDRPDLVIMDVAMPKMDGVEAMEIIKNLFADMKIVIMTAFADSEKNHYFLEKGAVDFIAKPFSVKNIHTILNEALNPDKQGLHQKTILDKRLNIIGQSKAIKECFDMALKVCNTNLPILITGENGTGKEMLADFIHYNSIRRYNHIIKINCSAVPKDLAENEFFGHEKGAFTGAGETVVGKLEQAHMGTLFLDEIGEIDMSLQKKLLRVLEYKSFERLGGNKTVYSDFRLICATNRDLTEEVAAGRIREDLYYRVNTVLITVPPLRDRKEDIEALVMYFIRKYQEEYMVVAENISPEAMDILQKYSWPGNVRELKNVVHSMVSLATREVIGVENVPDHIRAAVKLDNGRRGADCELTLDELEKNHILNVIQKTGGNKSKAAAILGISVKTLYNKLHRYGVN
ncbi:sigma-54-dependent transcriptional regulator [Desulfotruncus alcoholivorax]|uniref:sigma-54-dependent transcriptional regulator n=1 Tax=Desulfotruncus alcoholivorax TaxID=265477 RepID=UPI0003F6BAC5|nr:sigma-54 dependent transcriptional regulator [Desulfotruncus alcoholivorax]